MSASEKLKVISDLGFVAMRAEVMAVVEAAEQCREHSMPGTRLAYSGSWTPVDPQAFLSLGDTLTALEEALK